jgi:hypothetical protein
MEIYYKAFPKLVKKLTLLLFAIFRTKCSRKLYEGGFYQILFGCDIKGDRKDGDCGTNVAQRNAYKFINKKTFLFKT